MVDINNALKDLVNQNAATDDVTTATSLYRNKFFGFDESSFLNYYCWPTNWDYFPDKANLTEKKTRASIDKIHTICICIKSSLFNGSRQPILFSFHLNKQPGIKIFCEPQTILFKKMNESLFSIISFDWDVDWTKKLF